MSLTRDRTLRVLLGVGLFGYAEWFFGNLYEGVVLTPNLGRSTQEALHHWRAFFRVSNPVYYYIPLAPVSVAATLAAAAIGWRGPRERRRWLAGAAAAGTGAAGVTYWFVTKLNVNLFFGGRSEEEAAALYRSKIGVSTALGVARLALVATAFWCAGRARRTTDPVGSASIEEG